jgi:hypothetical protein
MANLPPLATSPDLANTGFTQKPAGSDSSNSGFYRPPAISLTANEQGRLFSDDEQEHGLARRTDPETSHAAAAALDANHCEAAVLRAIEQAADRGLIAAELPAATGLPLNTASARTRPLANKGLICDSGQRRKGPSGRYQIVWKKAL